MMRKDIELAVKSLLSIKMGFKPDGGPVIREVK